MAIPLLAPFVLQENLPEDERSAIQQWIRAAKTGDAAAFERIVFLHERLVLRFAQRLLLDPEDAKDAAQEVFLRLYRHLARFRDGKELAPWLYRITVNVALDMGRRSARRGGRHNLPLDDAFAAPDSSPNPEQELSQSQHYALILAALAHLAEGERAAVVLRDLEGRTTAETALIVGTSETTIRSQISTGRAKIKSFVAARMGRTSGSKR